MPSPHPAPTMPKSLLEQLPEIVAAGRKTAERLLEGIEIRHRFPARRHAGDVQLIWFTAALATMM